MKKQILALFLSLFILNGVKGQELGPVKFYGVDFSSVNVLYASETADQFISAFEAINLLMLSEPGKYDVAKYFNVKVSSTDVEYAIENLKSLQHRNFSDHKNEDIDIKSIISKYPRTKGNILIIVAKELNKSSLQASYDIVIFNGQTKKIVKHDSFTGKAGGFGLRNFWAGSIYKGMESYKKQTLRRR